MCLPMTQVTGSVFVGGAASPSPDSINILVTFRGILCKIYTGSKHATDIRMTLIEAFMDDGVNKRRSCNKVNKTNIQDVRRMDILHIGFQPDLFSLNQTRVSDLP